jgi:hypothetical protein
MGYDQVVDDDGPSMFQIMIEVPAMPLSVENAMRFSRSMVKAMSDLLAYVDLQTVINNMQVYVTQVAIFAAIREARDEKKTPEVPNQN